MLSVGSPPTIADERIVDIREGTYFSYSMQPYALGALRSLRAHTLQAVSVDGQVHTRYQVTRSAAAGKLQAVDPPPCYVRFSVVCALQSSFMLAGWLVPVVRCVHGGNLQRGMGDMTLAVQHRAEELWARR